MKWTGRRQSSHVEDRRGMSRGGKSLMGGGVIAVIVLLISLFGGENLRSFVPVLEQVAEQQPAAQGTSRELTAEEIEMREFVSTVFADTEDIWTKIFQENDMTYRMPTLVLFSESVETGCGAADASVGPFYCPADEKLYMDMSFFQELRTRFGAKGGDFAIAYVIAHEVGHHVQNLLGTSQKFRKLQAKSDEVQSNKLSVAFELQADFYAGVWAKHNQKYLEEGDIDEALSAAQAVGDDAIQKRVRGRVNPDSFTHGTSEQRKEWFMKGFETGDIKDGDTFDALF